MIRPVRVSVLAMAALALTLVGCTSTQPPVRVDYDASDDRTTYRAQGISIPIESQGAGYASQFNQLQMSMRARCQGRDCQPASATLTFSTSGSSELYIGDRTLVITADGERFVWEDPRHDRDNEPERVVGTVARITADIAPLRAMATAERVTGEIGSVRFTMRSRSRACIQSFLVRTGHLDAAPEA